MKRIISLLLAAVMVLSLCACGSSTPKKKSLDELTAEDFQAAAEQLMGEEAETQAPTEAEQKVYKLGETITMMDDMIELTVNSFGFVDDSGTFEGTPYSVYSSYAHLYPPEEGKTYLAFDATVVYKGNLKQTFRWRFSNYGKQVMKLDYNDGYEFGRKANEYYCVNGKVNSDAYFEPLSDNRTMSCVGLFEVPYVVETDTASPLLLKLVAVGSTMDSNDYYVELPLVIQLR